MRVVDDKRRDDQRDADHDRLAAFIHPAHFTPNASTDRNLRRPHACHGRLLPHDRVTSPAPPRPRGADRARTPLRQTGAGSLRSNDDRRSPSCLGSRRCLSVRAARAVVSTRIGRIARMHVDPFAVRPAPAVLRAGASGIAWLSSAIGRRHAGTLTRDRAAVAGAFDDDRSCAPHQFTTRMFGFFASALALVSITT